MFWDDAGLWLSPPDSEEKIAEDVKKIIEEYENRERYPFTGMIQIYGDMMAHKLFLFQMLKIFERIGRLKK